MSPNYFRFNLWKYIHACIRQRKKPLKNKGDKRRERKWAYRIKKWNDKRKGLLKKEEIEEEALILKEENNKGALLEILWYLPDQNGLNFVTIMTNQ